MFSDLIKQHKLSIAFIGDIFIFTLSVVAILYFRYGGVDFMSQFATHRDPFFIVLIIWLLIFYISNLYTYKAFGNILEITKRVTSSLLISFFVTISIFYIFSRFFELTPKANLVLLTLTFGILDIIWRFILRKIFIKKTFNSNILVLASSPLTVEVAKYVKDNPQLGLSIFIFNDSMTTLQDFIHKHSIHQIVVDGKFLQNNTVTKMLYSILSKQIEITTLAGFYESIFGCVPLSEIEEEWFIMEITENKNIYESVMRLSEIIVIMLTIPITVPLSILISLLVKTTSRGPIIYRQDRIGKNNKPFSLYKFRTMNINHDGPLWTLEADERITSVGRFLRHSHLDEIPQLWNVIKGDISFIGPRPERTKLAEIYEQIPYYEIRHIIKPGIIGWAQLNYKPSTSFDEAKQKFQFDLYYIKNRSFVLDLFIFLKTARTLFTKNK